MDDWAAKCPARRNRTNCLQGIDAAREKGIPFGLQVLINQGLIETCVQAI